MCKAQIDYVYYSLSVANNPLFTILDSTSNANHGTKKGAGEPVEIAGKAGMGQDFDVDYITLPQLVSTPTEVTLEMIVKSDVVNTTEQRSTYNDDDICIITSVNSGTNNKIQVYAAGDSGGGWSNSTTDYTVTDYHHIVGAVKANDYLDLYVDGAKIGTSVAIGNLAEISTTGRFIGQNRSGATPVDGIIDEYRLSTTKRSAAWIKATYASLWDTLLTYGDEETEGVTGANIMFMFSNF